jgi:hypothetical protein
MNFNVKKAEYRNEYRIWIEFQSGESGEVDLKGYVGNGEVFEKFKEIEYFKSFKVEYGTIRWGEGEADIAPERLYYLVTGKEVDFSEEEKGYKKTA